MPPPPLQKTQRKGQVALRYCPSTLLAVCFHIPTMPWLHTKCELPVSMSQFLPSCPHWVRCVIYRPHLLPRYVTPSIPCFLWCTEKKRHTTSPPVTVELLTHTHMYTKLFKQLTQNRDGHPPYERLSQQPCFHIILSLHLLGHEMMWVIASKCLLSRPSATMRVAATLRASWLI